MDGGLRLDGTMIPRRVKRLFDQRGEPRIERGSAALLLWRGRKRSIELINLSSSGAMIVCDGDAHIGEDVTLWLTDHAPIEASVQWVRDGRIGLHFRRTLR